VTRALIVIDVQNAVVRNAHDRGGVVARIADLVDRARTAGCPVIWVRHTDDELVRGSHEWELVDSLRPSENEPVIDKSFGDAFEGTVLQDVLAERGVTSLYVTGAQTDFCVRSTLHGAITRGHDAILVRDCHTTDDKDLGSTLIVAADIIAHTNFYWQWHRTVANEGGTIDSEEIDFGGD
jgi:nicotinamidase-related amidase